MAESCPRSRLAKIVLGIGGVFLVLAIVCFVVGGPLYIQERNKIQFYTKVSCRVRSASYSKCIEGSATTSAKYKTCYVAVWQVEFGQNGTLRGTIRGNPDTFEYAQTKSEQYKVGSSYPCWYNTEKPSQITWFKPSAFASLILLIVGGISIPFVIVAVIISCRLRKPADL